MQSTHNDELAKMQNCHVRQENPQTTHDLHKIGPSCMGLTGHSNHFGYMLVWHCNHGLIFFETNMCPYPRLRAPLNSGSLPNIFRSCTKTNIFGKASLRLPTHCRCKRLSVQNVDIGWTWVAVVAARYQGLSLPVPALFLLPYSGNFHTCYMLVEKKRNNPQCSPTLRRQKLI